MENLSIFVLVLNFAHWMWHLCVLFEIGDSIDCSVVITSELKYRHGPSSVVQSTDERGVKLIITGFTALVSSEGILLGTSFGLRASIVSSAMLVWTRVSGLAGRTLPGTAAALSFESEPTASTVLLLFWVYSYVPSSSGTIFGLFQTYTPVVTISPSEWGAPSEPEKMYK